MNSWKWKLPFRHGSAMTEQEYKVAKLREENRILKQRLAELQGKLEPSIGLTEAAEKTGLARKTWERKVSTREISSKKIFGKRVIPVSEIVKHTTYRPAVSEFLEDQ